jgi:hypothetical protein
MHPYHHVKTEDGRESLTVFMPSGTPVVATGEHPHFAELLEGAQSDMPADDLRNLEDLSNAVAQHFDTLSERVAVANGRVYFDGDEVDSTITQQIKRCLDDPDVGDWKPLVLFMENVAANPNEHSREQLFDWLRDREFTITTNGCFIAYKGVSSRSADDGYVYQSSSRGEAIVNGERFEGNIPNACGATVEMPRSDVQHDPGHGCSTGLHVGTYKYAQSYANAALLTVLVNPRDVVSVPTDCNAEKMRVCRYVVSDDDAKAPEESPAIEDTGRKLHRTGFPVGPNGRFPTEFYAKSGDVRYPAQGELYLYREGESDETVGCAAIDYAGGKLDMTPVPIMEPTEPRHGDELVDAEGNVQFYLDCPAADEDDEGPRWADAAGRDRAQFLREHEECFA